MGLIGSNNKRHQQCMNLNPTYPSPNSSKRAKFSAMSKASTPLPSSPASTASRVSRYPNATTPLHREVHAPCRSKNFALSGTRSSFSNSQKREIGKGWGNDALRDKYRVYQQAKDSALSCIRFFEKPKEAVLDDGSSVQEVYVIEDDDEEGPSMVTEQSLNVVYAERMLDTLSLSPEQAKKEPLVELVLLEPFVPLTKEEEVEVAHAFSADRKKVLVTHYKSNIEISGETFQCLRPGGWLNDEVIDLYLVLLKEREGRKANNSLHCHFFSTFFYTKLISGKNGYDFNSIRRWTSQKKLGYSPHECDKLFVPIHQHCHWCLAVINQKEKKFQYLDSLRGRATQVLKVLARYFVDEVKDKTGKDIDVSSWEKEFVKDLPEQTNGYDCGMFMIKYADFYSRNMGLCFGQGDMPYFRLRTAKEILRLEAD